VKKRYWVTWLGIGLVVAISLLWLWLNGGNDSKEIVSTPLAVSLTATTLPTSTPTFTFTPSPSLTATVTSSPTMTVTLATRMVNVSVVMPDVTLPPTSTLLPDNLTILAAPPEPEEPLPNATYILFPYIDFTEWISFESDHPAMRYTTGNWTPLGSLQASQGQYHFTEDTQAKVSFTFSGEAVRVRYVGFMNGGIWNVVIDGTIVDTIDSYAPIGAFTGTRVYYVGSGEHSIELHNTEAANEASSGHMLAFDAVQVYSPDDLTLILPGGGLPTNSPTPTLIPAQDIELVQAPPSPEATATEIPIQTVSGSIVIGYDENANGVIDVSEGVRGISVRLVEMGTNRIMAHTFTDEQGFAQLQASTNAPVLLVVPYFGESWTIQPRSASQERFTLLLSPGNQPGLIP
jgi:hypothetical protein